MILLWFAFDLKEKKERLSAKNKGDDWAESDRDDDDADDNNSRGDGVSNNWFWWRLKRKGTVDALEWAVSKIEKSWFDAHGPALSRRIQTESPSAAASHRKKYEYK